MRNLKYYTSVKLLLILFLVLSTKITKADQYDVVRLRWRNLLTGGNYNVDEPYLKIKVEDITKAAIRYWKTDFYPSENRTLLWKDLDYAKSSNITDSYARLNVMALAYCTKSSSLYKNAELLKDILSAIDWLSRYKYNTNVPLPNGSKPRHIDNWWDYKIGTPLSLNKILVLLYDELGTERREKCLAAIAHFTPDLTDNGFTNGKVMQFTAANRIWICTILTVKAILLKDEDQLQYARREINPVFDYVDTGDGFYKDGSFIQHDGTPYTGGYGLSLLDNLSILMYLLAGSPWEISSPGVHHVYDWIHNSFTPIVSGSGIMGMVTGREISRNRPLTDIGFKRLLDPVLLLAEIASPQDAEKLRSLSKNWLLRYTALDYKTFLGIFNYGLAQKIVTDGNIKVLNPSFYRVFPNMDRAVVHRPNYTFGISMHSSRTYNYESINNENLKGWHTGDGMTYLYNGDTTQFESTYWPTVNYNRLPGTTVEENTILPPVQFGGSNWVGGTSIAGQFGVSGMHLAPKGQSLHALKSWFVFDNEIVALGAGITNGDQKNVQTFVEQRKLSNISEMVSINGIRLPDGQSGIEINAHWAFLQGSLPNTSIGYYFPTTPRLQVSREQQFGTWKEINTTVGSDTTVKSNPFLTMWFNHGVQAKDQGTEQNRYAYVLLPGMSKEGVAHYSEKPDIRILENSARVQAVEEGKLKIVGANFWEDGITEVKRHNSAYLSCDKKASVMIQEEQGRFTVSIADPTMENKSTIELIIFLKSGAVIKKDSGLTVKKVGGLTKITANVNQLKGKTLSATIARL